MSETSKAAATRKLNVAEKMVAGQALRIADLVVKNTRLLASVKALKAELAETKDGLARAQGYIDRINEDEAKDDWAESGPRDTFRRGGPRVVHFPSVVKQDTHDHHQGAGPVPWYNL